MKNVLFVVLVSCSLLIGCGHSADGGIVTARDVLKTDKNADILKFGGRIYSNVTHLEWFIEKELDYITGEKIGEIKKVTSVSLFFTNYSATKLVKGTALYEINGGDNGYILVELENGEILYYMELLEG